MESKESKNKKMTTILGLHWTHFIATLLAGIVAYLVYYGNKITADNRVEDIKTHTSSTIDSSVKSIKTHTTSIVEKANKNDELLKDNLSDIKAIVEEIRDISKSKEKRDKAQIKKILNKIDKLESPIIIAKDLNVKLPDTLLLEEKRQFLKREVKKLIEGDLTFLNNVEIRRKQTIEEKNKIAYPLIDHFFKELEVEILEISTNEDLEVKSKFPTFPDTVFGKSINYSPWIIIKKNYAEFNLNNIFYEGKKYAGFRIDTNRSIDQRMNSAYIIFDTEKRLIYKKLDENGNYEGFSDIKEYDLTQSSVNLILIELIAYLSY